MTTEVFTRQDYMNNLGPNMTASHRRYYGQFVSSGVLSVVRRQIGESKIKDSQDPYFNDIPLGLWDRLEPAMRDLCLSRMGDVNGRNNGRVNWSLSDAVCIAKEAARQIKEQE